MKIPHLFVICACFAFTSCNAPSPAPIADPSEKGWVVHDQAAGGARITTGESQLYVENWIAQHSPGRYICAFRTVDTMPSVIYEVKARVSTVGKIPDCNVAGWTTRADWCIEANPPKGEYRNRQWSWTFTAVSTKTRFFVISERKGTVKFEDIRLCTKS